MAAKKSIRTEVEELRAALETLQAERTAASSAGKPAEASETEKPEPAEQAGTMDDIEHALKELADLSEKKITSNPTLAVGLAFCLGLLVGRLSKS